MKIFVNLNEHTIPSEIVGKMYERSGRKAIPDYIIISRVLRELRDKKLIRLMVKEKTKVGRLYELTKIGKLIKKKLKL